MEKHPEMGADSCSQVFQLGVRICKKSFRPVGCFPFTRVLQVDASAPISDETPEVFPISGGRGVSHESESAESAESAESPDSADSARFARFS